jgi:hypothetical protein
MPTACATANRAPPGASEHPLPLRGAKPPLQAEPKPRSMKRLLVAASRQSAVFPRESPRRRRSAGTPLRLCSSSRRPFLVPEGHGENSPTFQRWGRPERAPRPEGTVEILLSLGRPFGTQFPLDPDPNAGALGYYRMSLRDTESRLALRHSEHPNPRGLVRDCPMPRRFRVLHPEGMDENSPTFQRWGRHERSPRPEGTVETLPSISRPFGTQSSSKPDPNAEALGYYQMSLRDTESRPPSNHPEHPHPSGGGSGAPN